VRVDIAPTALQQDESLAVLKHFLLDAFPPQVSPHVDKAGTQRELVFDLGLLDVIGSAYQPESEATREYVYPLRFTTQSILLGPLYQAGQSGPCPRCLERRWLVNRGEEEQQALQESVDVRLTGSYPAFALILRENMQAIVEFALADVPAYAGGPADPSTSAQGWFYVLHPGSLKLERRLLLADSLCPICARKEPDQALTAMLELVSRPKTGVLNYRITNLLDYPLPEKGYINPESGLLGKGGYVELKHTVTAPVMGSYHPFTEKRIHTIGWGGHTTMFRSSRRVGLLEGLERYCGQASRQKQSLVFDSYENLAPHALDPRICGYYDPDVYQSLPDLTPPSPQIKMHWIWGYSLRTRKPLLVPEQLAYYGVRAQQDACFVKDTSNGCATGSCLEEAILHGLLELIERDTFLIHWYAKLTAPRIDPWNSRNPRTLRLLDRLERLGYDIYLMDTRLDIPVPTIVGVAVRRGDELGKLTLAAGASLDPEEAISTALCELAAYVPDMPDRVRARHAELQELARDFSKVQLMEQHMMLYGLPEMVQHAEFLLQSPEVVALDEIYAGWNEEKPRGLDLLTDLQYIVNWIIDLGIDVIVVDQTAPELRGTGLRVVKVLVPGLVPIDFGWKKNRVVGLPRMRTVPRTSGYRETDFALTELNLTPHPFP
jgi:ribosomal protein S12 methylthiotransferase accessory factor